ncbi:MAG: hypothetical protein IPM46_00855 [Flavobacteriales bacterium]|nr:hypothetical protein [Flavobacteriales bacterium]
MKPRIFKTDSGTVVMHYFASGQPSTKEWTDKDDPWGRSWAYKRTGEVIFDGQTRAIGGHASVRFSYHPNGAVSKVETSDMPDGGIQWYKSTTTFDEDGNKTGFFEHGRDNYGPIPRLDAPPSRMPPQTSPPEPRVEPKQEVIECQRMFVNELFVVNPTNAAVRVVAAPKDPSPGMPGGTWTMAPGDTIRIGSYSMGETWPAWKTMVDLSVVQVALDDRNNAVARYRNDEVRLGAEHRRVYVVIEGWTTTKVPPGQDHLPPLGIPEKK